MNGARLYSLERRVAKIERERGANDGDNPFNQILRSVGETACSTESEAFRRVLQLMQTPDWTERLRAAEWTIPP